MEAVGGVISAVFGIMLSVGLALLPVFFAIWVISQLRSMSREMTLLRRQLAAIAEHAGATVVAGPPARPSTRTPLWAFAVVLVVFVMVMGLLASLPSAQETSPIDVESEPAEVGPSERFEDAPGGSGGSGIVPLPDAVEEETRR